MRLCIFCEKSSSFLTAPIIPKSHLGNCANPKYPPHRYSHMSDGQAALMHHLLGSVNVMLYDMEDESFTPVVIMDSSCEYKTYKGEGCGPVFMRDMEYI